MLSLSVTGFAAAFASLANLFFKKSSEFTKNSRGYLLCFFIFSCLVSFLIQPEIFRQQFSTSMFLIGGLVGALNVLGMWLIAKALKTGPAGLIFAFQNASSVFPNLLLYMVFGVSFGYMITGPQLMGLSLVLFGLFLASYRDLKNSSRTSLSWYGLAIGCFLCQLIALTLIQWRCMLFSCAHPHFLVPFQVEAAADAWFMPGYFSTAALIQLLLFLQEKRMITLSELRYGSLGGFANAIATLGLMIATKWASPIEKGLIFPLFAVGVISFCNLWGYKLYQEKVDIKAHLICLVGILFATLV